ncbi:calcium-transporting P-type ATPase, PMR1-type [Yasminevirus sp. GU-2018]|uniref:Calcium-transporting P-type ATPase, PMR1-type n=1 Tax=Yasminevirus sp. GU-2018 TaxID=2420051 RepID=A0A5K0U7P2_9VIRU|nr:calcium-transporting P-type ATPase, PMR1-type [Yasminevirus sp. GU-2018]
MSQNQIESLKSSLMRLTRSMRQLCHHPSTMIVSCVLKAFSKSAILEIDRNVTAEKVKGIIDEYAFAWSKIEAWDQNYRNHIPSKESNSALSDIFRLFIADKNNTVDIDAVSDKFDESFADNTLNVCDWYYFNIIATLLRNSEQFRSIVKTISYDDPKFERHVIKRINHDKRLTNPNYMVKIVSQSGEEVVKNLHDVCISLLSAILSTVPPDGFDRGELKFMKDLPSYQELITLGSDKDSIIPYIHDVDTVCSKLQTSKVSGLTSEQVLINREKYGDNVLPKPSLTPFWKIVFHKSTEPMILFLIGFIAFEIVLMNISSHSITSDLIGVLLTVALVFGTIAVGTKQDYDAERSGNKHVKPPQQVKVVRDGRTTSISADDLVVGDIIEGFSEGENVPADGRVFNPLNFSTMESMLTGEPIDVKKSDIILSRNTQLGDRKNMCYACTAVSTGTASIVVTATGTKTEAGKLVEIIERTKKENQNKKTPLMTSIAKLSYALILLAVVFCGSIFFVGVGTVYNVLEILETSLSLAASAVPEGLPAILIITVMIVAKVMKKANCEIRNNSAVQTIGSVSIVCSDKTGTLTLGKMTARFDDGVYKSEHKDDFVKTSLLCNSVDVSKLYVATLKDDKFSCVQDTDGDTTEIAIIRMIQQTFPDVCNKMIEQNKRIMMCPFDSNRKRMSVIVEDVENRTVKVFTKGAPESVMDVCKMTESEKHDFLKQNKTMTKRGMRVLGVSVKDVTDSWEQIKNSSGSDSDAITTSAESKMTFVGIIGIVDPPKEGVKETVRELAKAHVPVVMITGDHPNTGEAIATELEIFQPNTSIAMTGPEFTALEESFNNGTINKDAFLSTFNRVRVFARVTPDEKRRIVRQYQAQGMIVAMLGDGPNDAPAIVEADVGYAMFSGTDLAKDNADVIVLDNKLNSLTDSIRYGRSIFDNVQKFIVYLISCNFAEVFTMFIFVCVGKELPFTTNMLLWANIFADIPPSIAISYEAPHKNIMNNYPVPKTKKIVSYGLFGFIFLQAILMTIYTALAFSVVSDALKYNQEHARTLAYTVLSAVQLTHAYWCRYPYEYINSWRSLKETLTTSKHVNYAVLLSFVLLIVSIYIPGFNTAVGITWLNWADWLIVVLSVVVHGLLMQIVKFVMHITNVEGRIRVAPFVGESNA